MRIFSFSLLRQAGLGFALFAMVSVAQAQGSTIRLVVPYPAGGASDFIARLIAPEYQKHLGQQIVVENIGGVSGALGIQRMLSAPPDGQWQVLVTPMESILAPLALNAVKFKTPDLRLVSLISGTTVLMLIRKDIPASNIEEFVAWAKGRSVSYASSGIGSLYHLMGERFASMTGLNMVHVPYKGGGQVLTDLAGGQVDATFFVAAGPVPAMVKEGRFKAIGVSSSEPHALFPNVQPMSRHPLLQGYNFDMWIGIQVPRTTPEAIVIRLNQAMNEVIRNPEVRKGIESNGSTMFPEMTPVELTKKFSEETERYNAIAKLINLKPQ